MPRFARAGETNGDLVDRFTVVHFASGVLGAAAGLPWWSLVFAGIAWELVEDPLKELMPAVFPNATFDRKRNSFADFAAFIAGAGTFRIARACERWIYND